MKTKNGHILTFSDKMQICAVSCFATCDWFCPMMSHNLFLLKEENIMPYSFLQRQHAFA